jgi:hypothetical protein
VEGLAPVAQKADAVYLPHRLRLGGARRGEETERDRADERSPVHYSIT